MIAFSKLFQSISPPFVASCTARVGSHTDNNVFVKFFGRIGGRFNPNLKPDSSCHLEPSQALMAYRWGDGARLAPLLQLPTRRGRRGSNHALRADQDVRFDGVKLESRLDYNRRALIDHSEQFDHVLVTHPHTAVTRSRADFVLVFGAMDVDEA